MRAAHTIAMAGIVVVGITAGCANPPSVVACQGTCEKRGECLGDVDVGTCRFACERAEPQAGPDCIDADTAFQTCLNQQTCADFIDSAGCDAEEAVLYAECESS